MSWTELDNQVLGGADFSVGTGADADATAIKVVGAIAEKAVSSGGPYGSGYGSVCYRITGETNMDPSRVHRYNSYTWEGSDLTWYMNLNADGLMVGGRVNDAYPYPQARLDIRAHGGQNTARLVNVDGSTYVRVQAGTSSADAAIIIDDSAGNPLFAFGRCPGLFGSQYAGNLTYGKFVSGVGWVLSGTLI